MFAVQVCTYTTARNINLQFQIGLQILQHSMVVVTIRTIQDHPGPAVMWGLLNTTTRQTYIPLHVTEDREANLARLMLGHLFFFHSSFIPTGSHVRWLYVYFSPYKHSQFKALFWVPRCEILRKPLLPKHISPSYFMPSKSIGICFHTRNVCMYLFVYVCIVKAHINKICLRI